MAEQAFGLDINIDDKFWSNFTSHPSRGSSFFSQRSTSTTSPQSPIIEKLEEPTLKKTAEEIIQGSQPLDEKMTALFQGDFKIDKQTKPSYHLLMDFEDKEGVPLILAKPAFTRTDVQQYFTSLEKPKILPPVVETPQQVIPEQTSQSLIIEQQQIIEKSIESKEIENKPSQPEEREIDVLNIRKLDDIPGQELEARALHVTRSLDVDVFPQTGPTKEEIPQPIVEEAKPNVVPVFPVPERRIEGIAPVAVELPRKKARLDGQILGNTLFRKISFDSFHYVKLDTWRDDQNFLFDRFVKRTQFSKYIGQVNTQYGSNHLIKSYFNTGILKSSYLVERYFRNPFVYHK